jgi:YesN/AraC family two-component response regulator
MVGITFRWLVDDGCEVVACHTVEAARVCLEPLKPDVLLTDVRLGKDNGFFLAVMASQKAPATRIIVMSGFDDPVLRLEAQKLNAEYLLKPLDRDRLRKIIG